MGYKGFEVTCLVWLCQPGVEYDVLANVVTC